MRQKINFCTSQDGVCIAYATAGRGPPLMRVGGWMTHVERDWNSPVWQHWLNELTREHTLEGKSHILQRDDPGWPIFVNEFRRFLANHSHDRPEPPPDFETLTNRELAVLEEIAQGLSNPVISEHLSISPKTTRNHVSNICSKLSVSSRAQLIVKAREAGFGAH